MSFGKGFRNWLRSRRLRRMRARDLPESEQELEPQPIVRPLFANDQILHVDQILLLKMGFVLTAKTPIGSGAFGSVFRGRTTDEALRYHSITNINGDYFSEMFEGSLRAYLPVNETVRVDRNYHVEELVDRDVAIKFIFMTVSTADLRDQQTFRREAHIMSLLHHPNIVDIYDVLIVGRRLFIVMEYGSGGSLNNFLLQRRLSQRLCLTFVQNLTAGLLYLHAEEVIHGDLHGNNVLVFRSGPNIALKYADFGLAEFVSSDATLVADDVRAIGAVFNQIYNDTDFIDQFLGNSLQELCGRLAVSEFATMFEVIRGYEFLVTDEYEIR